MNRYLILFFLVSFVYSSIFHAGELSKKVQGWIADIQTAEPLETVQVIVVGEEIGTITDKNGFFEITLNQGSHKLLFQMAGYQDDTLEIQIPGDRAGKIYVYLSTKPYLYDSVTVFQQRQFESLGLMEKKLDIGMLTSRPVLGEADILRQVQNLPGVAYTSDYSSLIYIRGSNYDQTQISFDDTPILNPYHLGAIYSGFSIEGVLSVQYSPTNHTAKQGGYLGGRINIIPRNGLESRNYRTKLSFGLISSKISYGNRFDRSSVFFTARRSYFDIVQQFISDDPGDYYFHDAQAGFTYRFSKNNFVSINCYYSRDFITNVLENDEFGIKGLTQPSWGNTTISLKWKTNFRIKGHLLSHVYYSKSDAYANTNHIDINNYLENFAWRERYEWRGIKHHLSTGFEIARFNVCSDWNISDAAELSNIVRPPEYIFFDYAPAKYNYADYLLQTVFYLQDIYEINSLTQILVGVRIGTVGKHFIRVPRFQLMRKIDEKTDFITTCARQEQYFYTLKSTQGADFLAPFSAYFLIQGCEKPLYADYFSGGVERLFGHNIQLYVEGYLKHLKNIPVVSEYRSHEVIRQEQLATGIDLRLERNIPKGINVNISYSLGLIKMKEKERWYFAGYDRRHHLKAECSYLNQKGWQLGLQGMYLSGLAYTPQMGIFIGAGTAENEEIFWDIDYSFNDYGGLGIVKGEKNSLRFPPYHRLDIYAAKVWYLAHSRLCLKIQVMNVYNHKNILEHVWDLSYQKSVKDDLYNFPTIPSIEISYEF